MSKVLTENNTLLFYIKQKITQLVGTLQYVYMKIRTRDFYSFILENIILATK
jgi:hypothetical protein